MSTHETEPAQQRALRHQRQRRRLALLLGVPVVALLAAAAVWAATRDEPAAEGTSTVATTRLAATTSSAPAALLPDWETKLPELSIREWCDAENAFREACTTSVEDLGDAARKIAQQADALGSRYAKVKTKADEVAAAAGSWSTCPATAAGSPERWDCVNVLATLRLGHEVILAEMYAVERP